MRLRDSTRRIITQLEEKSGYPVQVLEEADLSTFATIRIARAGVPAHVLSYKTHPPPVDYTIAWQCALALRLFERPPEQRFLIASSPQSSRQLENILNAPQGLRETYGLKASQVESLRDQLLQGLVTHLYSVAVGLRVSDRLTLDYPEFADLEVQLTERELQTNRETLSEQVRAALPAEVYTPTQRINAAYALYWAGRLEQPEIVNPYRLAGYEAAGQTLLRVSESTPGDPAHDYELVEGWADVLGLRGWFTWVKYKAP